MSTPKRYDRKSDPENTGLFREFRAVQVRIDDELWVSSGIKYVGEAVDQMAATSDPKWRIRRYANIASTGHIQEEYAGETQDIRVGEFNQIWDNRASLFPTLTTYPAPSFDGLATEAKQDVEIALLTLIAAGEPPHSTENIYDIALAVATDSETSVVSYTVPVAKTFYLQHVMGEGENIAEYFLKHDSSVIAKRRTMFGGDLTTDFEYRIGSSFGYPVAAGEVIELTVKHRRPDSADFSGRIYGVLI